MEETATEKGKKKQMQASESKTSIKMYSDYYLSATKEATTYENSRYEETPNRR